MSTTYINIFLIIGNIGIVVRYVIGKRTTVENKTTNQNTSAISAIIELKPIKRDGKMFFRTSTYSRLLAKIYCSFFCKKA